MKDAIIIDFDKNNLGRVMFRADVLRGDFKSHAMVKFKLDSGSDFTTIGYDILEDLGYSAEYLSQCPVFVPQGEPITLADRSILELHYLTNVSIRFKDREIQGCTLYFSLSKKHNMRNLLGTDILKYFNRDIDYDNCKLTLAKLENPPELADGETPLQIYAIDA